jgi:hypothetical protein
MKRRRFITSVVAAGTALAAPEILLAQSEAEMAPPAAEGDGMTQAGVESGYAPVNGHQMY